MSIPYLVLRLREQGYNAFIGPGPDDTFLFAIRGSPGTIEHNIREMMSEFVTWMHPAAVAPPRRIFVTAGANGAIITASFHR